MGLLDLNALAIIIGLIVILVRGPGLLNPEYARKFLKLVKEQKSIRWSIIGLLGVLCLLIWGNILVDLTGGEKAFLLFSFLLLGAMIVWIVKPDVLYRAWDYFAEKSDMTLRIINGIGVGLGVVLIILGLMKMFS